MAKRRVKRVGRVMYEKDFKNIRCPFREADIWPLSAQRLLECAASVADVDWERAIFNHAYGVQWDSRREDADRRERIGLV